MFRRLFRSRRFLAVAIMPSAICYLELQKTFRGIRVGSITINELVEPLFSGAKIKDFSLLAEQLMLGLKGIRPCANLFTSICATEVQLKTLSVPAVFTPAEVETEVMSQLARGGSHKKSALCVDFLQTQHANQEQVETNVVAAKADYIDELACCFSKIGMKVRVIDIDLFALVRATKLMASDSDGPLAFFYMDGSYALCAAWHGDQMIFHRVFDVEAKKLAMILDQLCQQFQRTVFSEMVVFARHDAFVTIKTIFTKHWSCPVTWANCQNQISGLEAQQIDLFREYPAAYVALGLALRGVRNGI